MSEINKNRDKSIPWDASHYYLINSVKYAYETVAGIDFIWLYNRGGKMSVDELQAYGYQVTKPKLTRAHVTQRCQTKMQSAGSIGYYGKKAA